MCSRHRFPQLLGNGPKPGFGLLPLHSLEQPSCLGRPGRREGALEPLWEPPAPLPVSSDTVSACSPHPIPVPWSVAPDVALWDMGWGCPGSAGAAVGPNGPQEHLNRSWQGHSMATRSCSSASCASGLLVFWYRFTQI